ncbi:MAG TPA: radical SAM protein [Spirochaetota bacterium]|nr:radical SAM protein [Spirochaetota bacterium]HPC40028.1 radical SAM protein [Spirochaetota bacterium]HPL15197.1 radical SAM protein [Spirochaetota bacterium]HQF09907.1 radical SAM protein [Spirochaetota bacterium]HQH98558.1 radical SAM protein [Spirochaetota bacterium]
MNLTVNEIFYSIQGETVTAGLPSAFVRLTGCNLDCAYCDTRHARENGTVMELDDIMRELEQYPSADHVTVTGGEPMLQAAAIPLMKLILESGWKCQVETNGSILLKDVPEKVRKIVDVKTPSSGESDSFETRNLKYLTDRDEIKFVISDPADYDFSKDFLGKYLLNKGVTINFSPVSGVMGGTELADLIIRDRLPVRLNLQLHKILWGPDAQGK